MNTAIPVRLKKSIQFSEIHWPSVEQILVQHFKLTDLESASLIKRFTHRMRQPFGLHWFINENLSPADNTVAAAICESVGADGITISVNRSINLLALRFNYHSNFEFLPSFKRGGEDKQLGYCKPSVTIALARFERVLNTTKQIMLAGSLISAVGAIMYAIAFGMLLYGISVACLFFAEPGEMTVVALSKGHIGLALLCTLIGIAGIFGRAIKNIAGLAMNLFRTKASAKPDQEKARSQQAKAA